MMLMVLLILKMQAKYIADGKGIEETIKYRSIKKLIFLGINTIVIYHYYSRAVIFCLL